MVLAEPDLVGREYELKELQQCLDSAAEGKGTTVFISGEAGSGKTRLVHGFLDTTKDRDINLLQSGCLSDITVPYFPFIEAFNSYFSSQKCEEDKFGLKEWLSGNTQSLQSVKAGSLTPQAWKDLTFVAITKTLLSIACKKLTILFIDDIHWADSASLALLHYLSRTVESARVLVLITFRSEELTTDAEGHQHPLIDTMQLMKREGLFEEIKLGGLNTSNISRIGEGLLGAALDQSFIEKLSVESQGNPLFVVESMRMLSIGGNLFRDHNGWHVSVDSLDIPFKFKDIVRRRLGGLQVVQRRVLDVASIIGEKINPELLASVLSQDVLSTLEALNRIAQATSLVYFEENGFRFEHAKIRQILYEEIPPPLKKEYHARVAQILEEGGKLGKDVSVGDLAYHFTQAENSEKALVYVLEAGKNALAKFSNTEAISHFKYVLGKIAEGSDHSDKRAIALQGLGEAFFACSMFKEAMKTFEKIWSTEIGIARLRAFRWALDSAFFQGNLLQLIELAKSAEKFAVDDRLESARVRMNKGRLLLLLGNPMDGLMDFEEALKIDEEEYSLSDAARTLVGLGAAYVANRRFEDALVSELRAISLYQELNDLRGEMDACNRAGQYAFIWLKKEPIDMFLRAIQIGEKIGDYNRVTEAYVFLAQVYEADGELDPALSQSLKALEYSKRTDSTWILGATYANLVRQYAKLGDIILAEEYYEKLTNLQGNSTQGPEGSGNRKMAQFNLPKAIIFAVRNQWEESMQCFNEILSKPRFTPHFIKKSYIWALEKQGLVDQAEAYREELAKSKEEALENYNHLKLRAHLMAPTRVGVGQIFEARLDLINVSKLSCSIVRIGNLPISEFRVAFSVKDQTINSDSIEIGRNIDELSLLPIKFNLRALKPGVFTLTPHVVFSDELGQEKSLNVNSVTINVSPKIQAKVGSEVVSVPLLPDRISTGFMGLDVLLYGGIPKNYSIVLVASPNDEREQLVKCFLETGFKEEEPTFLVSTNIRNAEILDNEKSNFYLLYCNPRADALKIEHPNLYKLKGVENLTEIDIALVKAFRTLGTIYAGGKRACIEIISDILLQHGTVITRKWLSGLLVDLKSRGFTTVVVVDPLMHPKEDVQAILSLFEGELRVTERESKNGLEKTIRVVKLHNQKYLSQDLEITQEAIEGKFE
jgi:tetratricopeptide (TPR) repeat protein/KaiC/GvpD/RAD55 family RecA-like ATPase